MFEKIKEKDVSAYIGILVGLIIGGTGLYFVNMQLTMNDAFWHIKAGEWVSQRGIVDKCYGSWVLAKDEWMAHEWLFGWFMYQISRTGMDNIVRLFGVLFLMTVFLCLFQAGLGKKNENPPMFYWGAVLTLQFIVYALQMTARPQYIAAIMIAIFLLVLNTSLKKNYKWLYLLPVLTIFWVNIHGGTSLLSYITVLVYLLCNVLDGNIGRIRFHRADRKWIQHCCIVLLLIIGAIMVNPYGYRMLIYPYQNMQDKLMVSLIVEWAPPDAKNIATLLFQIMPMLFGCVAIMQYRENIKAHDVALFFLYLILYLRSERFYPFLVVVQTCLITPYAFRVKGIIPWKKKKEEKKETNYRIYNNLSILLLGAICISYLIYLLGSADYNEIENNKELPDELLEQVCRDEPKRLCNQYSIGGYLLYHDVDVFVDGRYEPYNQKNVMNDYVALMHTVDIDMYHQIGELIDKYEFDSFLISTGSVSLAAYLEENPDRYELCYADEDWLYYKNLESYDIE